MRNVAAGSLPSASVSRKAPCLPALDHRILLQGRRPRRPDGLRGAHHAFGWDEPAGTRRHHGARPSASTISFPASSSASASSWSTSRSNAGRLYEGDMMRIGPGRRDFPRQLPSLGHRDEGKMDKDRFRRDMGRTCRSLSGSGRRLGIINENEPPRGSGPVLVK